MSDPFATLGEILPDLKRIFSGTGDGTPPAKAPPDTNKLEWEKDFPDPLSNKDMQKAQLGKRIIQIGHDDVTAANYDQFKALASNPKDMPAIYLDANDFNDKPMMKLMKDDKDRPYIVANASALKVTESFVKHQWLYTNKEVKEKVEGGQFEAVKRDTAAALFDFEAYDKILSKMGIKEMPDIYIDTKNTSTIPDLHSFQTSEGKNFIVINKAAINDVTSGDMLTAVMSHEFAHIKNGDNTAQSVADRHNNGKGDVTMEMRADLDGAEASCSPKMLQDFLRIQDPLYRAEFKRTHGKVSDGLIDASYSRGDDPHPTGKERIEALDAQAANMPQDCPAPPSTPKVPAKSAPARTH